MTQHRSDELLPHNHLAEGEVTGHFHAADGKNVQLFTDPDDPEILRLEAPEGAVISHQEHQPITLPPGNYLRKIVREYDHIAEEARRVQD